VALTAPSRLATMEQLVAAMRNPLPAYLEASDKIDWRALHKRVVIAETPHQVSAAPQLPEGAPPPRQAAETAKVALKMGRHRTVCWVVVSAATHTRPPWASRLTCNS
jgi:hypothetical protein